jgi:hypothetical protein
MGRSARLTFVALLLASLTHAPLPYAHCHELLSADQLMQHMRECHRPGATEELPHGWHFHLAPSDWIDRDVEEPALVVEPTLRDDESLVGDDAKSATIEIIAPASLRSAEESSRRTSALCAPGPLLARGCSALYCVLRI